MELKDYTTEQLRNELKRRAKINRISAAKRVRFIYVKGIVTNVINYDRSFYFFKCKVKILDEEFTKHTLSLTFGNNFTYPLKNGCFKKSEAPKVGDTVFLSHRLTKAIGYSFRQSLARVIPYDPTKMECYD